MEESIINHATSLGVDVTHSSKQALKFILTGVNTSFANGLRRVMIAEVPTLAIDLVTIEKNTTVLHDEYLANRLGLLPIDSRTASKFKYREECTCSDKCEECSVEYVLDVTCGSDETLTVTHRDIVPEAGSDDVPLPVPLSEGMEGDDADGIVIVKLRRNQRIHARLTATKGIGKMHAKWIPVATAVYQYEPRVELNERMLADVPASAKLQIAMSCPRKVFSFEDDTDIGGNGVLRVADNMACIFCDACAIKSAELKHKDLVRIKHMEGIFHFTVETTGCMPPEDIVNKALETLINKLELIRKEAEKCGKAQRQGVGIAYEETNIGISDPADASASDGVGGFKGGDVIHQYNID